MKKFKKFYIAFLSMALIFSFLAFSDGKILSNIITYTMVSADEFNNFTYTINNGSASISKYKGTDTNLIVPSSINGYPVNNISVGAFQGNKYIQKVTIESPITILYARTFMQCSNLETVVLPNTLSEIKDMAFKSSNLVYITIPSNVTTIGSQAFLGCMRLSSVTIQGNVYINGTAFMNCKNLMNVNMPLTCTINSSAFEGCINLNYINSKQVTIVPPKNYYPLFNEELRDFVLSQFGQTKNIGFMNTYANAFAEKVVNNYTNSSMNDTQKAVVLHDWLCDAVDYDYETTSSQKNHVDYSAFLYSTTVCDGYARAYYLLTKAAGIESYLVQKSGVHAWNLIKLGDHYFHVDATWDDGKGVGNHSYNYFLLNDAQMKALGGAHSSWSLSCPSALFTYDTYPIPTANYMLGDLNKDGSINSDDLIILQNYLLNKGTISSGDVILADLNFDGVLNGVDLTLLRQKVLQQ